LARVLTSSVGVPHHHVTLRAGINRHLQISLGGGRIDGNCGVLVLIGGTARLCICGKCAMSI